MAPDYDGSRSRKCEIGNIVFCAQKQLFNSDLPNFIQYNNILRKYLKYFLILKKIMGHHFFVAFFNLIILNYLVPDIKNLLLKKDMRIFYKKYIVHIL